jgi:hypothetical protein
MVLAKSRREGTMLGSIVKRYPLIEVRSSFRDLSSKQQATAQKIMPQHPRKRGPLFLSKLQDLGAEITSNIAIESRKVQDAEAIEDREQQQRIFGRLSKRISLFEQQTRLLRRRFGFKR